jgi:hypothetical protein
MNNLLLKSNKIKKSAITNWNTVRFWFVQKQLKKVAIIKLVIKRKLVIILHFELIAHFCKRGWITCDWLWLGVVSYAIPLQTYYHFILAIIIIKVIIGFTWIVGQVFNYW